MIVVRLSLSLPTPQLRFPERMLRLKAECETEAQTWEAELNKAHMARVNGGPAVGGSGGGAVGSPRVAGRGTVGGGAMDSPSKSMVRQVCGGEGKCN